MAIEYKVLGQENLPATTLTDVYEVPAARQAVVSTITFANLAAGPALIRLAVALAGAADDPAQYLAFDATLDGNDMIPFTLAITLGAGDVVRAFADTADVAVNVFGEEVT